jgi:predicted ATPase
MISPPYLTRVSMRDDKPETDAFPMNLPIFANGTFNLEFARPVTILVGENGSGKSTILEAIAAHCGFSLAGGNANHVTGRTEPSAALKNHLRFAWKMKPAGGFFLRAETLQEFGGYLDQMAKETGDATAYGGYGDKSLRNQSHGEGFIGILENRLDSKGVVLLDEPEAALSPLKQMQLLGLLRRAEMAGRTQVIIATHSPVIMSYPNAQVFEIDDGSITEIGYKQTQHFRLYRRFISDPENYHRLIFSDD